MIDKKKLRKYLKEQWMELVKLGKKEKILIVAILIASFIIGVSAQIGYYKLTYKKAPIPSPTPTPILIPATLQITSDKKEITSDATFSATFMIDSPNQGVEAADFIIDFDPDYISIATISAGNYFRLYPVMKIGTNSAKISGTAYLVNDRFTIPIGKGRIADIVFNSLNATEGSIIKINKEKTFVGSGGNNILGKTSDLEINIK